LLFIATRLDHYGWSPKAFKKKAGKVSPPHPSQEEKEAMTATLEKALLKDEHPAVQSGPLKPPPNFKPPTGDLGTAAPPLEHSSEVAAAPNVDMDYDYGGCYGGYQPTRFNSTLLNDSECDSRAEYIHHATRRHPSAPGYASYSAPFSNPVMYGQGYRASSATQPRESPTPQALDRMQQILEGIEHATSTSSIAIQTGGQGELFNRFRWNF
jgi:hypothetical protein